jgi:hypothetical protein
MDFGRRDVRKSENVQSLPVLPPGDASAEQREKALGRLAKAKTVGLLLPAIACGIFLALISFWAVRHLAG